MITDEEEPDVYDEDFSGTENSERSESDTTIENNKEKSPPAEKDDEYIDDPDLEDDYSSSDKGAMEEDSSSKPDEALIQNSSLDKQTEAIKNAQEAEKKTGMKDITKNDSSTALFFNRNKVAMIILGTCLSLFLLITFVFPMFTEIKSKKEIGKMNTRGSTKYIPDAAYDDTNLEPDEPDNSEPPPAPTEGKPDLSSKFPPPTAPTTERIYTAPSSTTQTVDIPVTNRNSQQKQMQRLSLNSGILSGTETSAGINQNTQNSSAVRIPNPRTGLNNPNVSGGNGYTPLSLNDNIMKALKMNQPGLTDSYQTQNNQSGKNSFMNSNAGKTSLQWNAMNSLWKGTIITAVLDTSINTDLPGQVMAHVTKNIYSSQDGKYLLIPQGSRLYGEYNSEVSYAQSQVQVVWNTLIRTDGLEINLGSMNGIDRYGVSGYKGWRTEHPFEYVKAMGLIAMFSIIDTSVNRSINNANNTYSQNVMTDVYAQGKQLGNKIVDRALDIQPTIKIKSGTEVNLITNLTIDLPPMENIPVTERYIRRKK